VVQYLNEILAQAAHRGMLVEVQLGHNRAQGQGAQTTEISLNIQGRMRP
jgi:hypothetical protein